MEDEAATQRESTSRPDQTPVATVTLRRRAEQPISTQNNVPPSNQHPASTTSRFLSQVTWRALRFDSGAEATSSTSTAAHPSPSSRPTAGGGSGGPSSGGGGAYLDLHGGPGEARDGRQAAVVPVIRGSSPSSSSSRLTPVYAILTLKHLVEQLGLQKATRVITTATGADVKCCRCGDRLTLHVVTVAMD